ncbi:hypothetical protein IMCC3317_39690 [Kordia antarctica]|uniref:TPM domain-containing protein n=1 Tax=Kordia antarctica TaxID=1218801 RepID=A0A7L4ZPM2_9FLAO|nr:TPM domain-containing protein [Kordia antarctica]QHI38575.1 hypothetical protein IMCC3317_39690 [Kordia antarctica]
MKFKSLLPALLVILCISCEATHKTHSHSHVSTHTTDVIFPIPIGFVNDFDNILSDEQEANLLELVQQHEAKTSNQIAIVTLTSIQEYSGLEEYSLDLANNWKVGQEYKNNGVLIALYMKDRRVWIQNGDGIMEKLTDDETLHIINNVMVPEFKNNDYYTGFYKGIEGIIEELE